MSHSYNKVWIHAIWSTKGREPLILSKIETAVYKYMQQQFEELGCNCRIVNGMPDHVHCLFLLNSQKSIAEVLKQVKGSTSHYINEQNWIAAKFAWQTGYAAYSVSESQMEKVTAYIMNQKQHHNKHSFAKEYEDFLKLYGFDTTA
jgi:putative transposase